MDQQKLIDALGLVPDGGMSITDIQMVQWGRDLIFECLYQTTPINAPPDDPVMFRLIFHDCREIKYRVYAHIGMHEQGQVASVADIAEMSLGKGQHHRDANIMTNHFAVTISYGELTIERDSQDYPLPN